MWCDVMWCDGTSIHAMSMISHEISWWDISVVQVIKLKQMIQVIQPIQQIQVMQVRLAHLWPDFWVIFIWYEMQICHLPCELPYFLSPNNQVHLSICLSLLLRAIQVFCCFIHSKIGKLREKNPPLIIWDSTKAAN